MRVFAWLLIVGGIAATITAAYSCYALLRLMQYLESTGPGVNWPNVILVIVLVATISVLPLVIGLVLLKRLRRKTLPESAGANDV